MERTVFKLVSELKGNHVHTTVFSGKEDKTLANTGVLIQTVGEWQLFGALLKLGAVYNRATKQAVVVLFEGDEKIADEYTGVDDDAEEINLLSEK
jgi:hypothetical protein